VPTTRTSIAAPFPRIGIVAAMMLLASAARADDEDVDRGAFSTKRTAVSVFAGSAAPFGVVGVQAEHAIVPFIVAFGGVGRGASAVQVGAGCRVQLPLINDGRGYAPAIAFSLSRGRSPSAFDAQSESLPNGSWWMNLEGSVERRADSGFLVRGVLGYGLMVDPTQLPASRVTATRSAYLALHVGWAF
jgi:hypothetical protein